MIPYSNLIAIDKSAKTPVFLQISTVLTENIRKGIIPAGARLPGSRALADVLGLHRQTVVAAYDELLAQGWLETRAARGTFVSRSIPEIRPLALGKNVPEPGFSGKKAGFPFIIDPNLALPVLKGTNALAFNDGFPDVRLAPLDALSRAYRTVLRQGFRKNLLFYADTSGEGSLRAAMADYLRETRGLPVGTDNVLITRGSTMAIYLAAQTVLRPGDVVVVGEISYGSANLIFKKTGALLQTVPVDKRGLDVDAIEELCKKRPVRMVYVTPHHHYPTTVTMPAERRLRLLQLAQTYRFCVLEDDYDYDFHYDCNPILPLAGADSGGHVIYVGSLCKAISPALRVGYAVAPAEVIESMAQVRRIIDRQGDNLLEAAVAMLFREGEMRRHLKKAQKTYHRRRDIFCNLLKNELGNVVEFSKPTGGMAVWTTFDPAVSLPDLAKKAKENGLYIPDGSTYSNGQNAARLGFASVNEEEMERGMGVLRALLK
ncbi:MAG: PLP-dependent aminotransferase family protein [Lewinellaceae bacterium]|nr:PLP-dependent aminotransferase family protein [Lewinellaceae bacterium]